MYDCCYICGFVGTTALIALLRHNELVVANVGDSRGVLCDQHGNAVPLSSDHKPHIVSLTTVLFSLYSLCAVIKHLILGALFNPLINTNTV